MSNQKQIAEILEFEANRLIEWIEDDGESAPARVQIAVSNEAERLRNLASFVFKLVEVQP